RRQAMARDIGDHDGEPVLVDAKDVEVVATDGGAGLEGERELDSFTGFEGLGQQAALDLAGKLELFVQRFLLGGFGDQALEARGHLVEGTLQIAKLVASPYGDPVA